MKERQSSDLKEEEEDS
jgi:Sec7-like guanine-nucleotide exchange factor